MGMDLVIEDSIEKAMDKESEYYIEDEMDNFVYKIREYVDVVSKGCADVLMHIDPYDDTVLSRDQVEKLIILGNSLLDEELIDHLNYLNYFKRYRIEEKDYIDFANDLINVCKKAIKQNKTIVVIGD